MEKSVDKKFNVHIGSMITLFILLIIGIFYVRESFALSALNPEMQIDSGLFPRMLGSVLIVLCAIGIVRDAIKLKKKDNTQTVISNAFVALMTFIGLFCYILLWGLGVKYGWGITIGDFKLSFFYIISTVYLIAMFSYYTPKTEIKKNLKLYIPLSIGFMVFIYFVFEKIMFIRF